MIRARSLEDIANEIRGSIVLLDVDGTLLPDGALALASQARTSAARLAEANDVYLASNAKDVARVNRIASELGVRMTLRTPAGKPSRRALEGIDTAGRTVIVIGDKYLIDGVFARRIGARFMPVIRVRSGHERLSVKASFLLDDAVSWFL